MSCFMTSLVSLGCGVIYELLPEELFMPENNPLASLSRIFPLRRSSISFGALVQLAFCSAALCGVFEASRHGK